MTDHDHHHHHHRDTTVIETIQSLVVAFVLAMTFRGFAVEGFVIPTGSMAPTLLGQHLRLTSSPTGYEFPAGVDANQPLRPGADVYDPMLGPEVDDNLDQLMPQRTTVRMGDRILVLKCLYSFLKPKRFDVVVFKNPTDPNGESGNYIKRLVGLPGESILLVDGDIFAIDVDRSQDFDNYQIQRKPEYIQRAVWQPVNNSDYQTGKPTQFASGWDGSFWFGEGWDTSGRAYACAIDQPSTLRWNDSLRPITDWTPYNMFMQTRDDQSWTSDIRVSAAIVPQQDGLSTALQIHARSCIFEFRIENDQAVVRFRPIGGDENNADAWTGAAEEIDALPAGKPTNIEFWHVDQAMHIYINGDRAAYLEYDWRAVERMRQSSGQFNQRDVAALAQLPASPPEITWRFSGSPVTLHRVRLDRDLFYHQRSAALRTHRWGFATHPDHPGVLGPEHYMMLGDNSTSSLDSRFWGAPHQLVAQQIDPAPFVVNRKLLIGKAWMVYFPSPYPVTEGGDTRVIPDFGRLRFIR